jgi:hypothetical protein
LFSVVECKNSVAKSCQLKDLVFHFKCFLLKIFIFICSQLSPKQDEETDKTTKTDDTIALIQTDVPVGEVTEVPVEIVVQNALESDVSDNLISQSKTVLSEASASEPTVEPLAASETVAALSEVPLTESSLEIKAPEESVAVLQVPDASAAEVVSTEVAGDVAKNLAKTSDSDALGDSQVDSVREVEDKTDVAEADAQELSVIAGTEEASKLELKYKYSEGLCSICRFLMHIFWIYI